jgi:DNA polymerase I-like protein with 3'-5' exonuclease and polymerase domains
MKIFSAFYKREVTAAEIKATKGTGQDLRQIGKRVVHAGNYDQGKVGLSNTLLKDGFAMTIYECGKLIDSHRENNPYVELYQSAVRRRIIKERSLYTSWGRHISFEDIRIDPALYRFGYSFVPQSEVGDLTNQKGLKYVGNLIRTERLKSDLILQVHDSVVLDAVPQEVYFLMSRLKRSMEAPRNYGGCFGQAVELSIPVEFKLGLKWGEGREYKAMPTEDEVNEYVRKLCPGA